MAVHIAHDDGENLIDEIKNFQDAKWVSGQEAFWRIFEFDFNEISPAVINLLLHFPNKKCVKFWKNQNLRNVLQWEHISKTMLTEFFQMCTTNDKAKALLYNEFPKYYVWDKKKQVLARKEKTPNIWEHVSKSRNQQNKKKLTDEAKESTQILIEDDDKISSFTKRKRQVITKNDAQKLASV